MAKDRYFDNAATTPVDPRVVEAMLPYFAEDFGNANSIHNWGAAAMEGVEKAREQVASLIGADDSAEIVFTSGATEANNWILRSFPKAFISPFEHSSLYETAQHLGRATLDNDGLIPIVPEDAPFVSLMKVNNEIGTIYQPEAFAQPNRTIHSDITQAVGKLPVKLAGIDYASFSGHKFYGPKGVGCLYARGVSFPTPFMLGGEQENDWRAGTLNVPGIVGMGAAAEIATNEMTGDAVHAWELRSIVLESLTNKLDFQVNGGAEVSPYILSLSIYGIEGESVVIEMDRLGFAISSGAACSSHATTPSHVLTALGLEPEWLRGTIRISFGRFNTKEAAQGMTKALLAAAESLNSLNA